VFKLVTELVMDFAAST